MKSKLVIPAAAVLLLAVVGMVFWMQRPDAQASAALPTVTVYKTPTCGCCSKWIEHLRANGFEVVAHDLNDLRSTKAQYGVEREFSSCHTAVVGGYVVEGHVPAEHVKRLLEEQPAVAGLAVPGMPMGSPGMEGAYSEPYDVLAFDEKGATSVFAHVE